MKEKIKALYNAVVLFLATVAVTLAPAFADVPDTRAWLSAGTTCEGGTLAHYTPGVPFKVSICSQWVGQSCGFSAQLAVETPALNDRFRIIGRTLSPRFSYAANPFEASVTDPLPIVYQPYHREWPYYVDLGGLPESSTDAFTYENIPLAVVEIVSNPGTSGNFVIDISEYSIMSIATVDPEAPTIPCYTPVDSYLVTTPLTLRENVVPDPVPQPTVTTIFLPSSMEQWLAIHGGLPTEPIGAPQEVPTKQTPVPAAVIKINEPKKIFNKYKDLQLID